MRSSTLAAALLTLAACDTTGPAVQRAPFVAVADRTAYDANADVRVTLANQGPYRLAIEPNCSVVTEEHRDGGWVEVGTPDCSRIRVTLQYLAPGETKTVTYPVYRLVEDPGRPGATYRLRYPASLSDVAYGPDEAPEVPDAVTAPFVTTSR